MALFALLEAAGIGAGDEIILPAFTCAAVPNAMIYRGSRPIYADIDPVTFNIDPARVATLITTRTRAIYAQHTFGISCDVRSLRAIADRHHLMLIEDLAHSLGASIDGRPHGAWGHAGIFSTDRTKVIGSHIGGCAVTSDEQLASLLRARQASAQALSATTARRIELSHLLDWPLTHPGLFWAGRPILGALRRIGLGFAWKDEASDRQPTGYPCRMPPRTALAAAMQLEELDANLAHRREVARVLETGINWYNPALGAAFDQQAWLRYSFLVRDREAFVERFRRRFDLGIWFTHPIFGRPDSAEHVGYRAGACPLAEHAAAHIVNFPTHARIPTRFYERLIERDSAWFHDNVLRIDAGSA